MSSVAKSTEKVVVDPKTGLTLEVKGFGSLKGTLVLRKGIDLTTPIYEQVKTGRRPVPKV